jgi:hypothetical protein
MGFDVYVASGEESAQEEQYLQAQVSQLTYDATTIPKYPSEIYTNFAGDYETEVPYLPMREASFFQNQNTTKYKGIFIQNFRGGMGVGIEAGVIAYDAPLLSGGITYSRFLKPVSGWSNDPTDLGQLGFLNDGASCGYFFYDQTNEKYNGTLDYSSYKYFKDSLVWLYFDFTQQHCFYKQSFRSDPFLIWIDRKTSHVKIGMKLYSGAGIKTPYPIASKSTSGQTTEQGYPCIIHSANAPDASYNLRQIAPSELPYFQRKGTVQYSNIAPYRNELDYTPTIEAYQLTNVTSIEERNNGGITSVNPTATSKLRIFLTSKSGRWINKDGVEEFANFSQSEYRLVYSDTCDFDLLPVGTIQPNVTPTSQTITPLSEDSTRGYLEFDLPAPANAQGGPEDTLVREVYRYLRLDIINSTSQFGNQFVATEIFGLIYSAGYPTNTVTNFMPAPANYDVAELIISNYSAVDPVPAGFPTPPVGIPLCNSQTMGVGGVPFIGTYVEIP